MCVVWTGRGDGCLRGQKGLGMSRKNGARHAAAPEITQTMSASRKSGRESVMSAHQVRTRAFERTTLSRERPGRASASRECASECVSSEARPHTTSYSSLCLSFQTPRKGVRAKAGDRSIEGMGTSVSSFPKLAGASDAFEGLDPCTSPLLISFHHHFSMCSASLVHFIAHPYPTARAQASKLAS